MAGQLYYYISALPQLGELGSAPPMNGREMLERLSGAGQARLAVEALLLSDDLLQREAVLTGELSEADPAVLTVPQLHDDEPLPECLAGPSEAAHTRPAAVDVLWEAYFRHAEQVAAATGNVLLADWIGYEVALRNALARRRASDLGLEPEDYIVATNLASGQEDFRQTLSEWASAPDPLAGMQLLDHTRWAWITQKDRWYSFGAEELVAYAAKLVLLERWNRTTDARTGPSGARRAG